MFFLSLGLWGAIIAVLFIVIFSLIRRRKIIFGAISVAAALFFFFGSMISHMNTQHVKSEEMYYIPTTGQPVSVPEGTYTRKSVEGATLYLKVSIHLSSKEQWIDISWMEYFKGGISEEDLRSAEYYWKGFLDATTSTQITLQKIRSVLVNKPGLTIKVEDKKK